jgi:(E)-4-hydroxy-3-methylbut-2-enyl-diphosphate synthase
MILSLLCDVLKPTQMSYCDSMFQYRRWHTREVKVGHVGIGGDNPIRLQSMTTTDTMDTEGTVQQSIRMIEAGSELVRITAPSKKEAENLGEISALLHQRGFTEPLVADIHFTPNAAEVAADYVEKIRVNPGNYADKKKFETHDYTDDSYRAELERIRERFTPLVVKCKAKGRAMRIGTNHGSLSDRILSRYGDTPLGMVESAMEFLRICIDNDYHDLVISMKASNPQVMVQAYRLMALRMRAEGMNYPLHVGVTEAGDGEDGRIKSAVGIGTLLEDGLGDTVRVSLTEEPEAEIPVARMLVDRYLQRSNASVSPVPVPIDPFAYQRRKSRAVLNAGDHNVPIVIGDLSRIEQIKPAHLFAWGYSYSVPLDKWNLTDQACDYVYAGSRILEFAIPGTLGVICDYSTWHKNRKTERHYPLLPFSDLELANELEEDQPYFLSLRNEDLTDQVIARLDKKPVVLLLRTSHDHGMADQRAALFKLMNATCALPVVIWREYELDDIDQFTLYASTDAGALFVDGLGDGVMLTAPNIPDRNVNSTAFGILQATRTRTSKTEYISCPSCGRTLFDLQETTAKIRSRTNHLKGVKIGIMGCIVNGPGEMADADYGYVGTGPGKITLYREKEVVKRNVSEESAVDELIELIKLHGDWVEVPNIHHEE